eukprot:TRINITY_DN40236_c0_g1_i1.p1 TRINITY_DN40236_c0_g1~~TRINITY_DN40236_c0_g1_i1.p1  ORF type:complete len:352 (-),score=66.90 TRINITY_DN40236_c0_g1_i1:438-1493(-)
MEAAAVPAHPDMEQGIDDKQMMNKKSLAFLEAAAMVTIWSLLVINEGAIRVIQADPSADLFEEGKRLKPFVLFLGGLLEVFFGILGFYVGISALVLRWYNTALTKLVMAIQTLFGYYVFIVFVIAAPAVRAADITQAAIDEAIAKMEGAPTGGVFTMLTVGQNRFLIALGILTSFNFCLALQGGQFVFLARLVSAATGQDFMKQQSGNKMRAVFWNMNLAFSGLFTVITGSLIRSQIGAGETRPYVSPPNVGTLPGLTITAGLLMLVWGLVGVFFGMSGGSVPSFYYMGSALVYLIAFLNFTIVQFGQLPFTEEPPIDGGTALHAGLVFMTVTIGPYFVNQADRERNGESY